MSLLVIDEEKQECMVFMFMDDQLLVAGGGCELQQQVINHTVCVDRRQWRLFVCIIILL